MLNVESLRKWFPLSRGFSEMFSRASRFVKAVDGMSFTVAQEEILGLVGESGCGKTTTGRLLVRLIKPTSGRISFLGHDITDLKGDQLRLLRRNMQMVFQDPYSSLNPRMTVEELLREPLLIHGMMHEQEVSERVAETLESVGLPAQDFLRKLPHEMSGGQRQRVAIARAIITNPKFIVLDEPVSMLDVSIRAGILEVLSELREKIGLAQIFITHDLSVARHICDRIGVMYLGKLVEVGSAEEIIDNPQHPYTKALLSAVPAPDPEARFEPFEVGGELPSPTAPPQGCRFHPRCPLAMEVCRKVEPQLQEIGRGHNASCFAVTDVSSRLRLNSGESLTKS
jgi:oligopeptide transport system ATP-binding protein